MAADKLASFWAEMQPLTLVAFKGDAIAAVPAVVDVLLRHRSGSEMDADLLRDAVSELSAAFVSADETDETGFVQACNAAFDEADNLVRIEMVRQGIAAS